MKAVIKSSAVVLLVVLSASGVLAQRANRSATAEQPIAEIAGKPVYENDIAGSLKGRLIQLQRQEYEIKKQALDSYIEKTILSEKAKAEGLTTEALLKREVDSKIPQPTNDAVRAYYIAQPNLRGRSYAQIKEQLRHALRQALIAQGRNDYIAELREKANVRVFLDAPRLHVPYEAARLRGNPHAPVTIVEFSDFQCPYCRAAEATVREILAKYPGKVSLAYRDFPLRGIHPHAQEAAEAARCAQAQGKFWAYHDLLMSNPPRLDRHSLMADAQSLHLNEKQFESCLTSGLAAPAIQRDIDAGNGLGVAGTPAFFINGEFLSGAQPFAAFDKIIRADLASTRESAKMAKQQ